LSLLGSATLLLGTTPLIHAQVSGVPNNAANLSAEDILSRALERAAVQEEEGLELTFEYFVESTAERLDDEGVVTETKTAKLHHYPLEELLYAELIERDGETLDENALRERHKRKTDFVRKAREHRARGETYEPNEMDIGFDHELMDRYDTRLVRTESLRGHNCWVLGFTPREGKLPDRRRMDKALNRSTGYLWIAQDDYGVARVSFEMQEPFKYFWGLVATLRHVNGQMDFDRIADNLWAPTQIDLELDLRAFFRTIRQHVRQDWVEHRPITSQPQAAP
jgi:hypothetical protein